MLKNIWLLSLFIYLLFRLVVPTGFYTYPDPPVVNLSLSWDLLSHGGQGFPWKLWVLDKKKERKTDYQKHKCTDFNITLREKRVKIHKVRDFIPWWKMGLMETLSHLKNPRPPSLWNVYLIGNFCAHMCIILCHYDYYHVYVSTEHSAKDGKFLLCIYHYFYN